MAKCKWWINKYCQIAFGKICPDGRLNNQCTKDIPPKPKDKVVKGWVDINKFGTASVSLYKTELKYYTPCTITIKAKDYAKLKGKI